ncbi:MAG: hypothetical protein GWM98_24925 [Nitrospinaceae bacterium]|nr:ShlB/FhaC/HecB family hemolysin secretion/activation protein [Nitrospinaceae bacterium]NIR57120.1 ShlB/FhaC/HecB family hemolysin secretion/activation protein [Nitrospinaceae bacterium]NIS87561.1 ShlB/FhaC/HecB family hemolysin secretion/activation protein [Nitrospinaceae bacterium]NIT84431.1 ShlB/FhaC/HecB family hemolysin secretion/activation protein [Nitrospinaceae bacterium]NIU46618.1 ShlB/FhaC/HecB family hemolysin secretion/activation protein [Nitrospinaceae bacterium]
MRRDLWWTVAVVLVGFPSLVTAQVTVPPAGESGVGQKALEQSQPRFRAPAEEQPDLSVEDSRKVVDPGEGPKFIVKKFVVEGNTLIDDETIAPLLDVGDGLEATLGVLHLIAQEITSLYAQEGYILSRAYLPEQEIVDGVVKIQVVEGRIGQIVVEGNDWFDREDILAWLDPLYRNPALTESALEKTLLQLKGILGLDVKSVLKPGEEFGTSDLLLKVEESRPFRIAVDGDNFGSRFTGEQRYGITAEGGSLLVFGDRLTLRGVKSNGDQEFISPSYTFPVGPYGTSVTFGYTFAEFNLGENLVALNAGGESNIFTGQINLSFFRTRNSEMHLTLGGEVRNFENNQADTVTSDDKLRDAFLELGGFFRDPFRARTFYNLRLQQGFSERDTTDPFNSRFLGRGDVFIASLSLSRYQSAFLGKTYFVINGAGQVVNRRVLSPDQFAVGGFGTVRGYPLAEAAGDVGFTASIEYVVPFPFKVALTQNSQLKRLDQILSIFGFLDHGKTFIVDKQPGERDISLSGAGAGFRLNIPNIGKYYPAVSFSLAYGFPVFKGPDPSDGSSSTLYLNGMISF